MELLGFAPSTVSKHLTILKQAGLVESQKEGRWVYYSLPGEDTSDIVKQALGWLNDSVGDSRQARRDADHLNAIVDMDPSLLCLSARKELA
jgi:ArsR family transcriptional regulator